VCWCGDSDQAAVSTVSANGEADNEVDVFRPRLCEVRTWSDYDGYGFDLHANDDSDVKYIGKIDRGSPAEAAGKCSIDWIEQGLASHHTHYGSYWGRVFTDQMT